MRCFSCFCGLAIALLATAHSTGYAQTTVLYSTGDVGVASVTTGLSNSGLNGFQNADGGSGASNGTRRMFIQWDVSGIPSGATINSAILRVAGTDNPQNKSYSVYRLTESWVEGNGGSNGSPIAGTGTVIYGANWAYRNMDPSVNTQWTTPGGTFDPAATLTFTAGAAVTGRYYKQSQYGTTYPVTYKMNFDIAPMVQAWVNGTAANNGVAIGSNEAAYSRMAMYGREYALDVGNGSNNGPVPSDPTGYTQGVPWASPALEITYTAVPEPGTVGLLAAGLGLTAGVYVRRRR